ncbi:hypothetical protein NQ315_005855, partial [Exocentrus adspersus]
ASLKYVSLAIKKYSIINVLDKINERFWKVDITDERISFLTGYLSKVEKYYIILYGVVGILLFMAKPFLIKNTSSLFSSYVPHQIPFFPFYATESYAAAFLALVYVCFNVLVCNFIMLVAVQFRLLNLNIKAVNVLVTDENSHNMEKCLKEIKRLIKYHTFLIRYVQELNKVMSTPFAILISMSIGLLCINMYSLSLKDLPQLERYRILLISLAIITEYALIWGLPAQLLMNEVDVEDGIFILYVLTNPELG